MYQTLACKKIITIYYSFWKKTNEPIINLWGFTRKDAENYVNDWCSNNNVARKEIIIKKFFCLGDGLTTLNIVSNQVPKVKINLDF